MHRFSFPLAVALAAIFVSAAAFGQGFRWLDTSPVKYFTDEDWTLFRSNMQKALDNGADGSEESWKNPKSGSHGSIKVLSTFQRDGLRCRTAQLSNTAGGFHGSGTFNLCKVADGSWKFAQ